MESELTPPPAARPSRAVTRKFNVRVVVGSASPVELVLLSMLDSFGNVLVGLVVAMKERNMGLDPLSVSGGEAVPRSNSSHP
jgi:hypothetical protein